MGPNLATPWADDATARRHSFYAGSIFAEDSQRAYLIEKGQIRWEGPSADLLKDEETPVRYLGV